MIWVWHYWPTLDYDDPLFSDEITEAEARAKIALYREEGWRVAFQYPTSIQFENKPEVSLFTHPEVDWLASPFYRDQTVRRLGAEIRVEAKRAERLKEVAQ